MSVFGLSRTETMETSGENTTAECDVSQVDSGFLNDTSLIDRFPYASRLRSNDVPSDEEAEEIKAFLREPNELVQQLEEEISSLETRLGLLRSKHTSLKNQVHTCRSLITTPRRLPPDILLEIFFHCLPATRNPAIDGNAAPLLLTRICRRWRILAIQTRTLWSAIHIELEDVEKKRSVGRSMLESLRQSSEEHLCRMLSTWLERSGTAPLTFSLLFREYMDYRTGRYRSTCPRILPMLLPFASQWKNVFIEGDIHSMAPLLTTPLTEFQSLETFYLKLSDDRVPPAFPMFKAPCLRKVGTRISNLDITTLDFPWARLTHLDLHGQPAVPRTSSVDPLSTSLSQCSSLIYLGLDIPYGIGIRPMYLPNLQRISIRQHTQGLVPGHRSFVENLEAPALQEIMLQGFRNDSFPMLLSKHGGSIRSLKFDTRTIQLAAVAQGLRYCPSLKSITITRSIPNNDHIKIDRKFFSLFIPSVENNASPLCPTLQHLEFDKRVPCESLADLISFLEVKQKGDPLVLSRLVRISAQSVQDHVRGETLLEEMVKLALKPFPNLIFEMWNGVDPHHYFGYAADFQYSDCWRD